MHESQSYQWFPGWLYRPLMYGALTLAEASELFDLWLMIPPGESRPWPAHLLPIRDRLHLWRHESLSPTRH